MCENKLKERNVKITLFTNNGLMIFEEAGIFWSSKDFIRFLTKDGKHIRYSGEYLIEENNNKK